MKKCSKCKIHKKTSDFARNRSVPSGFSSWCKKCHKEFIVKTYPNIKGMQKDYRDSVRLNCILHYSKGRNECFCCGERELDFLALDHMNNGGTLHRQSIGGGGLNMFLWIKRNQYPDGFQVLCHNCNWGKQKNGSCPHNIKIGVGLAKAREYLKSI